MHTLDSEMICYSTLSNLPDCLQTPTTKVLKTLLKCPLICHRHWLPHQDHSLSKKKIDDMRRFKETEDCFIVGFDPSAAAVPLLVDSSANDVSVIAEKGQVQYSTTLLLTLLMDFKLLRIKIKNLSLRYWNSRFGVIVA